MTTNMEVLTQQIVAADQVTEVSVFVCVSACDKWLCVRVCVCNMFLFYTCHTQVLGVSDA